MQQVDSILDAAWVIPVEPGGTILQNSSVVIDNGNILAIGPSDEISARYQAEQHLQFDHHVLIPGLVNTHTHAAMSLLKGLADDMPLMQWLQEHIWPAEQQWVSEAFVRDGTRLAIAEMIRSGTTCFNDMYFFPETSGRVALECGMRAVTGLIVLDFPTIWANHADEYIAKGLEINDLFRDDDLITTAFAPHAPYTVSDEPLQRIQMLADELEIPVHMHVHETADEVQQATEKNGMRPLARLKQLGLLSPSLVAVHMTQLQDDEIAAVAEHGVHVVHCPQSNMKLASGFCPVQRLIEAGANVALGTDGNASNNDLDMLGEMQSAALLAKAVAGNASALPALQAIEMATLNGARALGLDHRIGSLVKGKAADITAIDISDIESQPLYHADSQVVYSSGRECVTDVWINGQHLLKERHLTSIDRQALLQQAQQWQNKIHE